jgi:predicted transcriptional regulator
VSRLVETIDIEVERLPAPDEADLDAEHVSALVEQIRAGRPLPPIRLNTQTELVQGRHRLAAHVAAVGRADVVSYESPEEEEADMLAENLYRRKLPPAEEREALRRLVQINRVLMLRAAARDAEEAATQSGCQVSAEERQSKRKPRATDAVRKTAEDTGRSERTVHRALKTDAEHAEPKTPRPPTLQRRIYDLAKPLAALTSPLNDLLAAADPRMHSVRRHLDKATDLRRQLEAELMLAAQELDRLEANIRNTSKPEAQVPLARTPEGRLTSKRVQVKLEDEAGNVSDYEPEGDTEVEP